MSGSFPSLLARSGSAAGLAASTRPFDPRTAPQIEIAAIVVTLVVGVWAAGVVERALGKDPGPVVIDEVLGMLVTLALLDVTIAGAVVGFFLFRVFDVVKPYPGRPARAPARRLRHHAGRRDGGHLRAISCCGC